MNKLILGGLAAVFLLGFTAPAGSADFGAIIAFSDKEISTIRAYYQDHGPKKGDKKKGKGRKGLPPGIAKNLRRGKPLPPGIAKQALPDGLVRLLPPVPRGYERVILDGKVILVEVATQVIHDILEDIVLR
jgi:hypothetical protein